MQKKRHKLDYRLMNINNLKKNRFVDNDDENLLRYFHDMHNYKLLSQDEEQEIIRCIKNGDKNSDDLKSRLIGSHQPFVVTFAKRHCPRESGQLLDLIQEGNYGMLMALENFDITANVKFITYANAWIVKYMYKFLENNELIQKNNRSKTFGVDIRVREKFIKDYGYEPSSDEMWEIFNEMGISIKYKEDLDKVTIMSLNNPPVVKQEGVDEDDDLVVEFGEDNTLNEDIDRQLDAIKIRRLLDKLTDVESCVIKKKYGIDDGIEEDVSTIAYELGTSVYKINQIISSTISKLKRYGFLFE